MQDHLFPLLAVIAAVAVVAAIALWARGETLAKENAFLKEKLKTTPLNAGGPEKPPEHPNCRGSLTWINAGKQHQNPNLRIIAEHMVKSWAAHRDLLAPAAGIPGNLRVRWVADAEAWVVEEGRAEIISHFLMDSYRNAVDAMLMGGSVEFSHLDDVQLQHIIEAAASPPKIETTWRRIGPKKLDEYFSTPFTTKAKATTWLRAYLKAETITFDRNGKEIPDA